MPAAARDELRLRVSAVTVASNDEREFLDGPRDARVPDAPAWTVRWKGREVADRVRALRARAGDRGGAKA
ncbi:hypothetical protein CHO01_40340 [Cellulomonas hominis]|uniref:Uncharacterized protein n=1 Tax=Cellulomonas hominis TaxID=156981 RepID=A0A511FM23_9CELL|nr:hypothetical protein CHO01_40340 [Cellulomonas hominis]